MCYNCCRNKIKYLKNRIWWPVKWQLILFSSILFKLDKKQNKTRPENCLAHKKFKRMFFIRIFFFFLFDIFRIESIYSIDWHPVFQRIKYVFKNVMTFFFLFYWRFVVWVLTKTFWAIQIPFSRFKYYSMKSLWDSHNGSACRWIHPKRKYELFNYRNICSLNFFSEYSLLKPEIFSRHFLWLKIHRNWNS